MDRRAALDALEVVRPDADDLHEPEFAEALAYLETDDEAREIFARCRDLDLQIAAAMEDVPVPGDLKARLLSALAGETEAKAVPVEAAAPPPARSRRWVLSASVVVASCLLAGLGLWFFGEKPATLLSLQELEAEAPFEETEIVRLPEFAGSFTPAPPNGLWASERWFAFSTAKGYLSDSEGAHRVAVYEFSFHDPEPRHPGRLRGVMLVVPRSELSNPPESLAFFDGAYVTHQAKPRVAIRSWTEGESVYICMVPIQHFEALNRVFDIPVG